MVDDEDGEDDGDEDVNAIRYICKFKVSIIVEVNQLNVDKSGGEV